MTTQTITGYLQVAAEEAVVSHDHIGFELHHVAGGDTPWLDIFGTVTVNPSSSYVYAIDTDTRLLAKVTIEAGGAVNAITPGDVAFGVIARGPMTFVNDGDLNARSASSAYGLYSAGPRADLTNNGSIHVQSSGGSAEGFALSDPHVRLINTGEVLAEGKNAYAVFSSAHLALTNTGSIQASGREDGADVVAYGGAGGVIDNQGSLVATADEGAERIGILIYRDGDLRLQNSGTISGRYAVSIAYRAISDVTIHNSGRLAGAILLGTGEDDIVNSGVITRIVHLGGGDDTFTLRGKGLVKGEVHAGYGADTLIGAHADDRLSGDVGADHLQGGAGADLLSGGEGVDTFVYLAAADSDPTHADLITDLDGSDVIDLSVLDADTTVGGAQAFALVGAFGDHAGELVVSYDSGINETLITGDVDGDGVADLAIRVSGDVGGFEGFVL